MRAWLIGILALVGLAALLASQQEGGPEFLPGLPEVLEEVPDVSELPLDGGAADACPD